LAWNRFNLHAEIHRHAEFIPEPVLDFYRLTPLESFQENIVDLEDQLSRYSGTTTESDYFKWLFLGLCYYFIGRKSYVAHLERAQGTGLYPEFLPLIIQLIYENKKAERILVIVSYDEALNRHIRKLSRLNTHITIKTPEAGFDTEEMFRTWNTYDQVFLIGHGEDRHAGYEGHIKLGDTVLTPTGLLAYLESNPLHPKILGVFACGSAFHTTALKNHFDFFITDHESSVPMFAEMFLYGYLVEYYRDHHVQHAFESGRLATLFRAKSDPTYKMYVRGVTLQE
jgi:hypothetical protein